MSTYREGSARTASNGLAIAGLACGVVGLFLLNIVLGPLAIIFGSVGLSKSHRGGAHHGMSIAAIVLGVADIVVLIVVIAVAKNHGGTVYFRS